MLVSLADARRSYLDYLVVYWLFLVVWIYKLYLTWVIFFFSSLGSDLFVRISCMLIILQTVKSEVAVSCEVPEGHP